MKNLDAKKMIELHSPNNDEWFGKIFPWTGDFMCPHSLKTIHRDSRIIKKLKKRLSPELFAEVDAILKDSGCSGEFEIVRSIPCEIEDDFYDDFNHEKQFGRYWIDEEENGGFSGDSFSGLGYIKISNKDFLRFQYSQ